jgi:Kef-type K+ transport system membrane component KefB
MFTVGPEFDAELIRQGRRAAAAISGAGIAVPFVRRFQELTGTLVSSLLLPVLFVHFGLNTRFGLVDSAGLWGWPRSSRPSR